MPTKKELFEQLKIDIAAGKGLQDSCHLVNHDAERVRRRENRAKSTRVMIETHSPQSYSEFHEQKERYIRAAVDPSIAIQLMIRALAAIDEITLQQWIKEGHQHPDDQPGPPKAEIPSWLK